MRVHIRALEILTVVCFLAAGLVAPLAFAQSRSGTIVINAAAGGPGDMLARHFARNLGGLFIVDNKPGLSGVAAAREMRGKAVNGSELMLVLVNEEMAAAGKAAAPSEYTYLTPVAMLGESQSSSGKSWYGLFAPPGTPPSVVNSLNARVRQLMASAPTSNIQYAQDMSAGALSQRLAAAARAQPATPSAPSQVAAAPVSSGQDCANTEYWRQYGNERLQQHRTADRAFEVLLDQFAAYYGTSARHNDATWLRSIVEQLKDLGRGRTDRPSVPWAVCMAEARIAKLTGKTPTSASTTTARLDPPRPSSTQQPSNPGTAPSPAPNAPYGVTPSRPAASGSAGTASPGTAPAAKPNTAQAQQHQAALDEQRRGKPKRHYAEREAHHCLALIKATDKTISGGFINTCNFPVRFAYCAYKPKKDSWTESFDCEKLTGKLSGIDLIKPHERSAYHTLGAQKILWFACRADSTKEEIFEVGDGEFDPSGPFIRARCVKWNDRS